MSAYEIHFRMKTPKAGATFGERAWRVSWEIGEMLRTQAEVLRGHVKKRYTSYPASGPTQPDGLRQITGNLNRGWTALNPQIFKSSETYLRGSVKVINPVWYAFMHEHGATIAPTPRQGGYAFPARKFLARALADRKRAIGRAIQAAFRKGYGHSS